MAKTIEKAKSRVSASKKNINQNIEDFTGIHSGNDVVPLPLEGIPVSVKPDISSSEVVKVKVATPPVTKIPSENKDDIQKGIDKISGNSSSLP
jgi:hypothetical protein